MPDRLFDISTVPFICTGCGEEISEDNTVRTDTQCDACWVNTACPATFYASETGNDPCREDGCTHYLMPDEYGQWYCNSSDQTFFYTGRDHRDDFARLVNWNYNRWGEGESRAVSVRGILNWRNIEDLEFCEFGDHYVDHSLWDQGNYGYCPDCAEQYERDEGRYDDDYEGSGGSHTISSDAPIYAACHDARCTNTVTHWHPVDENAYCPDHAPATAELVPTF